jgi:SAM-dependent methyltransferase
MDSCIACQGELTLFGPYSKYVYCRCRRCGSIQLSPMPSEAEMALAYQGDYVAAAQTEEFTDPEVWRDVSRTYCTSVVATLKDNDVRGLVVDYGAGWGFLLEMMIANGFDARGLEIAREELTYAQRRGLPMQEGDLNTLKGLDGQVAAITMLAVFEHLVNHDAVLSAAHRLLQDGGLFVTLHPTAAIFNLIGNLVRLGNKRRPLPDLHGAFTAPWHTALFSIEGTDKIVSRNGFRLLEIRPAPQGRIKGLLGLIQMSLELVNKMGWAVLGTRWPLVTTHIFVFQKMPSAD